MKTTEKLSSPTTSQTIASYSNTSKQKKTVTTQNDKLTSPAKKSPVRISLQDSPPLMDVNSLFDYLDIDNKRDQCGQIANDMIVMIYEKIVKVKEEIKRQLELRTQLEDNLEKAKVERKTVADQEKRLKKEVEKIVGDSGVIEKDCIKLDKEREDVCKDMEKAINESSMRKAQLEQECNETIESCEQEKRLLFEEKESGVKDEQMSEEEKKIIMEQDAAVESEIEQLKEKIKIVRMKEENRLKKFKNNSKALDVVFKVAKECKGSPSSKKGASEKMGSSSGLLSAEKK